MIIVQHGGGFYSVYCHLSDIKVSEGDKVVLKQVIGNTGDTESFYGDELYFEIRSAKGPLDPLKYLVR
jgi:murein DD-endopeptidase MepM/ murein hydrolase activator NlpD